MRSLRWALLVDTYDELADTATACAPGLPMRGRPLMSHASTNPLGRLFALPEWASERRLALISSRRSQIQQALVLVGGWSSECKGGQFVEAFGDAAHGEPRVGHCLP